MTQGLSDVCDPHFNPKRGDPHEQQLFTKKTKFCSCCSVQTGYGRAIV